MPDYAGGMTRSVARRVAACVGLLIGCTSGERSWTMFPAPILKRDPRLDFARGVALEDRSTEARVFYATTRAPAPEGSRER